METITLREGEEFIRLGQALKAAGFVDTGADAKFAVADGKVMVNGEVETRRGRKLRDGDEAEYEGRKLKIVGRTE